MGECILINFNTLYFCISKLGFLMHLTLPKNSSIVIYVEKCLLKHVNVDVQVKGRLFNSRKFKKSCNMSTKNAFLHFKWRCYFKLSMFARNDMEEMEIYQLIFNLASFLLRSIWFVIYLVRLSPVPHGLCFMAVIHYLWLFSSSKII